MHAYVLMTNHVHLLVSTEKADAIAAMMKALGQRYGQYNTLIVPIVSVVLCRKSAIALVPFKAETYLFVCQRYIELHPGEYRWSSYATNAQSEIVWWMKYAKQLTKY